MGLLSGLPLGHISRESEESAAWAHSGQNVYLPPPLSFPRPVLTCSGVAKRADNH